MFASMPNVRPNPFPVNPAFTRAHAEAAASSVSFASVPSPPPPIAPIAVGSRVASLTLGGGVASASPALFGNMFARVMGSNCSSC